MRAEFVFDERLGIPVPELAMEWDQYSEAARGEILMEWELIRGRIPDRIKEIERVIIRKQEHLNVEENFVISCALNWEIAEMASTINDLHLWYRTNQEMTSRMHM